MLSTNILGSLNLGRRALTAHQLALDTIGHNLANAATPGYSRQRAALTAASPRDGVDVTEIQRIRDRFLDLSLLAELQSLGKAGAQEGLMQRLQAVFNDPAGTGLSPTVDRFFGAFQDLSASPTDSALRTAVKDTGERLAMTLQTLRARVTQLKDDLATDITQRVTTANTLLSQIAELNGKVVTAGPGGAANDLLDRRDRLVAELTQIVGVTPTDRADGSIQLAMTGSGVLLVDGTTVASLTATLNTGTDAVDLTAGAAALAVAPKSGALGALVDARNSATGPVKQTVTDLDTLAKSIIGEVNRVHASGAGTTEHTSLTSTNAVSAPADPLTAAGLPWTPVTGSFDVIVHDATGAVLSTVTVAVTAGVTTLEDVRAAIDADANLTATISGGKLTIAAGGGATFTFANDTSDTLMAVGLNTFFTGTDALTMAVNPVVAGDIGKIAAAQADGTGLVHPGDGANALALARLSTTLVLASGTSTFTGFYASVVGRIGSEARDAIEVLDRQEAIVQVASALQQQAAGVSTDEELVALNQSQMAYAAAARFVTTMNEIIESLLRMGT